MRGPAPPSPPPVMAQMPRSRCSRAGPGSVRGPPACYRCNVVRLRKIVPLAGIAMLLTGCATTPGSEPTTKETVSRWRHCLTPHLLLTLDRVVPGLAQQPGAFFRLTNMSRGTCMLEGYPTLQPILSSGQLIGAAVRDGGSYQIADPGPHRVVLTGRVGLLRLRMGGRNAARRINGWMCEYGEGEVDTSRQPVAVGSGSPPAVRLFRRVPERDSAHTQRTFATVGSPANP